MSTPAQIAANRRNAQKSTGPITLEGRNRTRLNALQHGITRQVTIMTDDERAGFMESCAEIVADFAPAGAHERRLAQAIAADYWRLDRSRAAEHNLFALGLAESDLAENAMAANSEDAASDGADDTTEDTTAALTVDDPRVHTAFVHAQIALDQADRKAEEGQALEEALRLHDSGVEAPHVRAVRFNPARQLNETESLVVNGFVFSNHDLRHESDRRDRYWNPRPTRRGPSQSLKSAA